MFNFEQIESIFNYAKKNIKIFSTCGDKKQLILLINLTLTLSKFHQEC